MSSNQNPVVAVDHVQKSFGEVKVLRDISLAVNPFPLLGTARVDKRERNKLGNTKLRIKKVIRV